MKKDVENMRNRTIGINVRVNENEKKKLTRNAKKSGLKIWLSKPIALSLRYNFKARELKHTTSNDWETHQLI